MSITIKNRKTKETVKVSDSAYEVDGGVVVPLAYYQDFYIVESKEKKDAIKKRN